MKKIMLPLFAIVLISEAKALSFRTTIFSNDVPKIYVTEKVPEIRYAAPGSMVLRVKRMCGDGDVAHFSQLNPSFDFVDHDVLSVPTIMGAWIVEEGQPNIPTAANWIPFGHIDAPVPMWEGETGMLSEEQKQDLFFQETFATVDNVRFTRISGKNHKESALSLLGSQLFHLFKLADRRFDRTKNYQIYSGLFMCHEPNGKAELTSSDFRVDQLDLAHTFGDATLFFNDFVQKEVEEGSLSQSLFYQVKEDASLLSINEDLGRSIFEVKSSGGPGVFKAEISNSEKAYQLAKKILGLARPSELDSANQLADYKQKMSPKKTELLSGLNHIFQPTINQNQWKSLCQNLMGNEPRYFWEAFPMELTCSLLKDPSFVQSIKTLFDPSFTVPSEDDFKNAKKAAAITLYKASLAKVVQAQVQNNQNQFKFASIAKPHCFVNHSEPMISKILYSVPFKFSLGANGWELGPQNNESDSNYRIEGFHPEVLFAIKDYKDYMIQGGGDVKTIFHMTTDKAAPQDFPIRTNRLHGNQQDFKPENATNKSLSIDVMMRSIGGKCPFFC